MKLLVEGSLILSPGGILEPILTPHGLCGVTKYSLHAAEKFPALSSSKVVFLIRLLVATSAQKDNYQDDYGNSDDAQGRS